MLRRFAPKAILCFDPDAAGQSAAERSCELLVGEGFDVNVALLPGGLDPDTFIQKHGRDAYVAHSKQSRPYLEFLLDRAAAGHDLARDDERREFLEKMLVVAARIPDAAARDQFADRLAHKARVTEDVVRDEIRKAAAARKHRAAADRLRPASARCGTSNGPAMGARARPRGGHRRLWRLEPADLEGLTSQAVLEKALALLPDGPGAAPSRR